MSIKSAGLSIQDAWKEAEAELSTTIDDSQPVVAGEPEPTLVSDVEQPAVETEVEDGLFSVLASENVVEQGEESLHEVKVNGVVFKVTLPELIAGYQRQADYTQGRQEIAEQKEKYGKAITLWDALEADYVGTVKALMSRSGIGGQIKPAASGDVDIEALVEQKLQETLASDPRIQAFEQERSLRQIEAIFSAIEGEFDVQLTVADKQFVLERAQLMGTTDLRYVTWGLLQERQKRLDDQKNLEMVSTVTGRRSGVTDEPVAQSTHFNTPLAAFQAALAEEDNLR